MQVLAVKLSHLSDDFMINPRIMEDDLCMNLILIKDNLTRMELLNIFWNMSSHKSCLLNNEKIHIIKVIEITILIFQSTIPFN